MLVFYYSLQLNIGDFAAGMGGQHVWPLLLFQYSLPPPLSPLVYILFLHSILKYFQKLQSYNYEACRYVKTDSRLLLRTVTELKIRWSWVSLDRPPTTVPGWQDYGQVV